MGFNLAVFSIQLVSCYLCQDLPAKIHFLLRSFVSMIETIFAFLEIKHFICLVFGIAGIASSIYITKYHCLRSRVFTTDFDRITSLYALRNLIVRIS